MASSPLHAAIEENDLEMIDKLLKPGPFKRKTKRLNILNTNNDDGHTPLTLAINHEKKEVINILLTHGADPNQRSGSGSLPLTIAAGKINHHDVLQLLIEANAKVDSDDTKTALMCSAEKGLVETVGFLVLAGA